MLSIRLYRVDVEELLKQEGNLLEKKRWMFHIDTPIGTISVSDKNDQPGGLSADWEKDEIMVDLSGADHEQFRRIVFLFNDGNSVSLWELMNPEDAARERDEESWENATWRHNL